MSRVEKILQAIIDGTSSSEMEPAQSRNERLLIQILDKINSMAENGLFYICLSGEYDESTGEPTIENPNRNIFYLVPNGNSGDDFYEVWAYTGTDWEHIETGGGIAIPQSDWEQSDDTAPDYIKNKPTVEDGVLVIS